MRTLKLKEGITWTGVLDPNLRVFDIIMKTEYGTTYNSYLVEGSEKIALVETAKLKFYDEYIETLDSLIDISKIDYIIVDHTEPDHAGSIEKLIQLNPNIVVVGTPVAINFLKDIINKDFYSLAVKENETLSLGDKTLRFMILPNLHWPDTMYTYVEEDKVLFTCDSFGAHFSDEGILKSKVTNEEGYQIALKYYFDNIIGPFKNPYMVRALERIKDLEIDMICTGHGPVLDCDLDKILKQYHEWSTPKAPHEVKTVLIAYVSAYGYTEQLAFKIRDGIKTSGRVDVKCFDLVTSDINEVMQELNNADGILLGTPTIIGEALAPIWSLTTAMFAPIHSNKLASAFGSYGWSGEGVPHIIERLKQIRLKVLDGFRVKFKPSDANLVDAFDFGYNFGCVLLNKKNEKIEVKKGSGKVKCLICGAILDEGEEICPVCGVGKENFVSVDDLTLNFHKDSKEHFVILGGGSAAYNAAREIRFRNDTCKITIISDEAYLPYNRPMLTKALLANFSGNQMAIENENWYKNNKINLMLNTKVVALHPDKKEVVLENGTITYDKCIYALGATCFVPPIEGNTLPEVVAIRSASDVHKITGMLDRVKHVVVIGGGVLGLEAAWELNKAKCTVTVLEMLPTLMPRQLDEGASDLLRASLNKNNMNLRTSVKIKKIVGENHVEAVELEDGTQILADLVVISAGVRANTKIAQEAGITVDKAIVVNEKMETSIADIYAAGDCAEFEGVNFALWSEATEMGKIAGANAAGDDLTYTMVPGALSFFGLNTNLYAIGDTGRNPDISYKTLEVKDAQKGTYEKLYFANNLLCGFILVGDLAKMKSLNDAYSQKKSFAETMKA
ncbi:MAG: FAD-dependent oxidoreductase [Anaerorhabdus sp.]|uniref:FAD-dependent oxidoreductase n=1 Tax=Anaerorhabdus sp. TaxID=1872524 RepID=UPI003A88E2F9